LEEQIKTTALNKPGPQGRYLVVKMAELEKSVQEVLSKLTSQLASIEKKVDGNATNLSTVRE
jgi:hypothetical protein